MTQEQDKERAQPAAPPMQGEMKIIQEAIDRVGIKSLLNHGAGSLVWSEGVEGVTQDDLLAYTREVALHCAVALAAPRPNAALADGWMPIETAPENELLLVGWVSADHGLDCHDFDMLEDGGWHAHEESRERFQMVSMPGCTGPAEKPPYTHWKRIGPLPVPPTLNASKEG